MYKRKARLEVKQKQLTEQTYPEKVPRYPTGFINPPIPKSVSSEYYIPKVMKAHVRSAIYQKRENKHKSKSDKVRKKLEFDQKSRELWNLMTLVDTEKEDQRLANCGIQKIWGETQFADSVE